MKEKRYPRIRIKESDFPYDLDQHDFRYFLEVVDGEERMLGVFFMHEPFHRKQFTNYKNFEEHYWAVGNGVEPENALGIFFSGRPELLGRFDEFINLDHASQRRIIDDFATIELLQNFPTLFQELIEWPGYSNYTHTNYGCERVDMDEGDEIVLIFLIQGADAFAKIQNSEYELLGDPFDIIDVRGFGNDDDSFLGNFLGHEALVDVLDIFRVYDLLDVLAKLSIDYCNCEEGDEADVLEFIQEASPIIFTAQNIQPFIEKFIAEDKTRIVAYLLEFAHKNFGINNSDLLLV